jgi:ornithine carbamoyltransferase
MRKKLKKEPLDVDFTIQSAPWTAEEREAFSTLIQQIKAKRKRQTKRKAKQVAVLVKPSSVRRRTSVVADR